jgi:hypothetical protein
MRGEDCQRHPKARRRILDSMVGVVLILFGGFVYWRGVDSGTGHIAALALVTLGAFFVRPSVVRDWAGMVLPFVRSQEKPPETEE